jgi:hypothetical protein
MRLICLSLGVTAMPRMKHKRSLDRFKDALSFWLTKSHPDLIIKDLIHTVISESGAMIEIHQYCWDVFRRDTGGLEFSQEPTETFLTLLDKFRW